MARRLAIGMLLAVQGMTAMATESAYTRTAPGVCELKDLPASVSLKAAAAKPYFGSENGLFSKLFAFIRDHDVAMTIPVEAEMEPGAMRFYVGSRDRAKELADTAAVTVEKRAARTVAACGTRGAYTEANYRKARATLESWLATQPSVELTGPPYIVYWNSPFVPGFLKTSEVHVPVRRLAAAPTPKETPGMARNPLTPDEERVIVNKGTEPPFSGRFWKHAAQGTYVCRRCAAPLYTSASKFDSSCGWPSFDAEIAAAVRRQADADGRRVEIVCAHCGGHLGHVFSGEGYTPTDTRHCVNSLSLDFVPATDSRLRRAVFASGCFWGTEYVFQQAPGVVSTTVGYTGGHTTQPTYRDVCSDQTGHAEAVEIVYDPEKTTYEALCRLFFETHDPTQVDRQGPDVGTQYRSAVFVLDDEQQATADKLIAQLRAKGLEVATAVVPAERFWPAEDKHQDYYRRTGKQPYCHSYTPRF